MATYKVLQDIEAEDKFVGPLTLKQFILACIAVVTGYLCVLFASKNLWILAIPLLPVLLASGFLAFPWGRDQPTETWLLAKIRFALKPRRRIWDQSGMQELVTITAPKHLAEQFSSNNLSQIEVKSRLKALANTIDSRGWAVKNANVNLYTEPGYGVPAVSSSDRLVDVSNLTQDVPTVDIQASDDIMDERNNPTAQHLNQMITASAQAHRQQTMQQLQAIRDHKPPSKPRHASKNKKADDGPPPDYWFMNQPQPSSGPKDYVTFGSQTVLPGVQDNSSGPAGPLTASEQQLLDKRHKEADLPPVAYGHTRVIEPIDKQKHPSGHGHKNHKSATAAGKPAAPNGGQAMTVAPDPAILNLANNDDFTVATIARQANKKRDPEPPNGEVIVPLR